MNNMNALPKIRPGADDPHHGKRHKEHPEHPFEEKKGFEKGHKGESLASSLEKTKARVMEVLKTLNLDAGDVLTQSGEDILEDKLGKPFVGIIESGGKKPVAIKSKFLDADVVAYTSPGLPKVSGEYPENRDGFVMIKTQDGQGLQVVMSHGVSEGPESAALANTASISAGYDLQRMQPPHMTEVFDRANEQVNGMKKDLDVPKQRLALLGLTMKKGHPESPLYDVEIFNAGDIHCFVLSPQDAKFEHVSPMTVSTKLDESKIPLKKRRELLDKYSKETGETPEKIEKVLTMSAGVSPDFFNPKVQGFTAAPGEIVVVASSDFMRSFGGIEYYFDKGLAQRMTAKLKRGQKLNDVVGDLMRNVVSRQHAGEVEDFPITFIAFEVPKGKTDEDLPKEHTVDEILGEGSQPLKAEPLELDFSEFEPKKDK